ncbi:MAG TPA: hypothetical protein QF838_06155 [SAR202 cluster bacterium]|nr:hypothetical protein [SAR202 cluster bacterium]
MKKMMRNWKLGLIVAGGILVIAVAVGAFMAKGTYFSQNDQTQAINSDFNTVLLEQKNLKTYESFSGTLKYEDDVHIITTGEGVLTYLAPEGQGLTRGAEIYRIYQSPEDSELLAADQQVTSADANVAQAELTLENLNSPATAAQIASADANVAQAELTLENLNSPATAAQIASADANVAQAELTLENLNSPATAAQIASADANVAQAELTLENLNSPATAAQIASADANVAQAESNLTQGENTITSTDAARLIARQSLCSADKQDEASWLCPNNLRGQVFPDKLISSLIDMISNNILSAEANSLLNAQKNYEAALESLGVLEKNLEQVLSSRLGLDEPSTEAEVLQATQTLNSAKEQRLALNELPTEAELLQANLSLQSSKEQRLALNELPTEAELLQATQSLNSATSSLNIALQNRQDLIEGYSASLLMFGELSAWRDMKEGIAPGEDINQLKLNLIALGYGTTETLEMDSTFGSNTTAAIMKLQSDLNLISSGEINFGEITFVSGTSMVNFSSTLPNIGGKINTGTELFSLTPIERISTQISSNGAINISSKSLQKVEIQVDVADQNLVVKGSEVEIELPDESTIVGVVDEVGSFAIVPQDGDPFLEVSIAVEGSAEYFKWTGALVTVNATKELAKGVLASPVNGLLALLSGGYALEIVTETGTILVPVETGIYADGWVEINGSGLQPGTEIVVPSQ